MVTLGPYEQMTYSGNQWSTISIAFLFQEML
ncbi:hypothetical protein ABID47_000650 [Paenibacillus favisporus]|uniref:Uncharacterized protein n=1 Tax=Paenibacillus favisporus TaxID=221028 RepID=A0ABV2EWR8_9BACL